MDEFQKLILEKFDSIEKRFDKLELDLNKLETKIDLVKKDTEEIKLNQSKAEFTNADYHLKIYNTASRLLIHYNLFINLALIITHSFYINPIEGIFLHASWLSGFRHQRE